MGNVAPRRDLPEPSIPIEVSSDEPSNEPASLSAGDATIVSLQPGLDARALVLMHTFGNGVQASVSYNKNGPLILQGANALASRERVDLRVAMPFTLGAARAELALAVQNLGPAYIDYDPLFRFQRQGFLTLRVRY